MAKTESLNLENTTRTAILNQIRGSLRQKALPDEQTDAVNQPVVTPLKPQLQDEWLSLFTQKLTKVAGTWERIADFSALPLAIKNFLQTNQLPLKIVADKYLQTSLAEGDELEIAYRPAEDEDTSSVSLAFLGVAETGSLVFCSQADQPTNLLFLPANHLVVLPLNRLVAHLEAVWQAVREQPLPRSINFVTGPSRTADIEQTIQLGAHGPRRLHVILVES